VISPSNYDLEEATEKSNEYRYESSSGCGTATELVQRIIILL
jgi:hypothetical protein